MTVHRDGTTDKAGTRRAELPAVREAVAEYRARRLAVCRVRPGAKRTTDTAWTTRSLEAEDFGPRDLVGVLGGPLSDGGRPEHALVIIDLDSADAVELADRYLPPTGMAEGRPGKPRSHRYFLVPSGSVPAWAESHAEQASAAALAATGHRGPWTKPFACRETNTELIKFIGTGAMVVVPPSTHPSRERREWEGGSIGEPAAVAFPDLWRAAAELASRCGYQIPADAVPPRPSGPRPARTPAGVEDRAVKYLAKLPHSVSGAGGHNALFWAARCLVYRFDLDEQAGFRLLADHFNPRCQPPWSEAEMRHKCEDGDRVPFDKPRGDLRDAPLPERNGKPPAAPPEAGKGGPRAFQNYRLVKVDGEDEPAKVGKSIEALRAELAAKTGGWPRRVGPLLFTHEGESVTYHETPDSLFAWAGRQWDGHDNAVDWAGGAQKATKAEFVAGLRQTAEDYDAVEVMPHEPPVPRTYYAHPEPAGGDGSALRSLLGRFCPATEVDADLLFAFWLSLFWGGPAGQHPAWLVAGPEGDGRGGRGVGKTTLVEVAGDLAGGFIAYEHRESAADFKTRLLSPESRGSRVVLLDNIKSRRFSSAEVEAMITAKVVSGRQLYVGEGRRPNHFLWGLTMNGASLSRDIAARCIPIRLGRPAHTGTWRQDTTDFIEANRWAIVGDILAALRSPRPALTGHSRWGAWEAAVLSLVRDPAACQTAIRTRQQDVDADDDAAEMVRDAIRELLTDRGHDPDAERVNIPVDVVAKLIAEVTGEKHPPNQMRGVIDELGVTELQGAKSNGRRVYRWVGPDAPDVGFAVNLGPLGSDSDAWR